MRTAHQAGTFRSLFLLMFVCSPPWLFHIGCQPPYAPPTHPTPPPTTPCRVPLVNLQGVYILPGIPSLFKQVCAN